MRENSMAQKKASANGTERIPITELHSFEHHPFRVYACEILGIAKVPAYVLNLNDDMAAILLVESNIQRGEWLPSEKAYAYQMRMEAMKRQGLRTDLTSSQIGTKFRSDELLAKK